MPVGTRMSSLNLRRNMEVVEKKLKETPHYENKHPSYGTIMRIAKAPIRFKPSCRNHSTEYMVTSWVT